MWSRKRRATTLTILSVLLSTEMAVAAEPQHVRPERRQFFCDKETIHALAKSRDFDGLKALAAELEAKWSVQKKEEYGYIMLEICGRFSSLDHEDERHYELARQYARSALEKSGTFQEDDRVPVEVELDLLEYVLNGLDLREAAKSSNWRRNRADVAKLHFRAWKRLENTIENFDPKNVLKSAPPIPEGAEVWTPLMSPEYIESPELRASYEVELRKYTEKARKYYAHLRLCELQEKKLPHVQESLLRLYSGPSFKSEKLEKAALQQDIEKYVKNKELREKIVDRIYEKLDEKSKGIPKARLRRGGRSGTGTLR